MQDTAQRWKIHVGAGQSSQQGAASQVKKTGSNRAHWGASGVRISAKMEIQTTEPREPRGDGAGRQEPGDRVTFSAHESTVPPPPEASFSKFMQRHLMG